MAIETITILTGKVINKTKFFDDDDEGVYVGYDRIDNFIYRNFKNQNIRITIEIIEEEQEYEE